MTINWSRLTDPFPAGDVEWRIGQAGKQKSGQVWAKVLAYITARAIQDRLDEVFGPGGWKNEYRTGPDGGVICRIHFRNDDGEWVWREDGADNTEIEAVKGGLSNALKRAGSALGIGRYLYRLDEGFAQIATDRGPGFRYARLPKDKGGDVFYWSPPDLPAWALPEGSSASIPQRRAAPAPPPAPSAKSPDIGRAPAAEVPSCPECDGAMWDNREGKRNPKAPDFKCKDKSCEGVVWPERTERTAADDAADLDRIVGAIQSAVNEIKGLDAGDGDAAQKVLDEYVAKPGMTATRLHRLQTNIVAKLESMREEVPSYDEPVPFPDAGAPV